MRDAGGGAIVNTASDLSYIALGGLTTYVTSKSAIPGLTRVMAADLADHGVRVNAVAPGFVYSGMTAGLLDQPEVLEPMRETYLIKDLGSRSTSPTACCSWPPTRPASSPAPY